MNKQGRKQGKWTQKHNFGLTFFYVLGPFWIKWVWAKKGLYFENQIKKIDIITLMPQFDTSNYPNISFMTQTLIFI